MPEQGSKREGPRTVAVVGCGVIGLPTALLLAQAGNRVIGVDIDQRRVEQITSWQLPYVGPSMRSVMADPATRSRLSAQRAMPQADVYIIAAPTPLKPGQQACDLGAVEDAVREVATRLRPGGLVILESTVPPRTCVETGGDGLRLEAYRLLVGILSLQPTLM